MIIHSLLKDWECFRSNKMIHQRAEMDRMIELNHFESLASIEYII